MTLKVVDRFTTRDGLWEVDPRPYGLTKEAFDKYGGWDIPGKGGASHIFVWVEPGEFVTFFTSDGNTENSKTVQADNNGWLNFPMWKSAAYWGKDNGPWCISIYGTELARGLGLPEGYHVSTFLIVEDIEEGSQQVHPPLKDGYINIAAFASEIKITGPDGKVIFDWSRGNE